MLSITIKYYSIKRTQNYNLLLPFWPHLIDCKTVKHKDPGEENKIYILSFHQKYKLNETSTLKSQYCYDFNHKQNIPFPSKPTYNQFNLVVTT